MDKGQVRIVGGRWRNTRLAVPALPGLRPSSDRVRETLFNWLTGQLAGARVLDLFAGTGALGLEALSRGADSAVLVEHDPGLARQLDQVVTRLKAADQARIVNADALAWLEQQAAAPSTSPSSIRRSPPACGTRCWPGFPGCWPPVPGSTSSLRTRRHRRCRRAIWSIARAAPDRCATPWPARPADWPLLH